MTLCKKVLELSSEKLSWHTMMFMEYFPGDDEKGIGLEGVTNTTLYKFLTQRANIFTPWAMATKASEWAKIAMPIISKFTIP